MCHRLQRLDATICSHNVTYLDFVLINIFQYASFVLLNTSLLARSLFAVLVTQQDKTKKKSSKQWLRWCDEATTTTTTRTNNTYYFRVNNQQPRLLASILWEINSSFFSYISKQLGLAHSRIHNNALNWFEMKWKKSRNQATMEPFAQHSSSSTKTSSPSSTKSRDKQIHTISWYKSWRNLSCKYDTTCVVDGVCLNAFGLSVFVWNYFLLLLGGE